MKKLIEKIFYSLGVNFSGYNLDREIKKLERELPDYCLGRDISDLGCGDGRVSRRLMPILRPKTYLGIDTARALVRTANKNGLRAKIGDIENQMISGDLGLLWGVLHHCQYPVKTLKKLLKNFNCLIIRESIDDKRLFELGHKFGQEKLMSIIIESGAKIDKTIEITENKSVIIICHSNNRAYTA